MNLLAELDAEFGKKAKKKADRDIKVLGKQSIHEANATLASEFTAANAIARSMRNQPGWVALSRVTHVAHEHCNYCNASVSYIGNVFTMFQNKRLRARTQTPELITHDGLGFELPHSVEEAHHTVEYCAACLTLSRKVEDLIAACFIRNESAQLSLAFWE